jgi:hypothetical protein
LIKRPERPILRAVRALAAFLAVTAIFVAINALGAGVLFVLFRGLQLAAPAAADMPWVVYPLGIAGLAFSLWLTYKALAFIERLPRGRARGRA